MDQLIVGVILDVSEPVSEITDVDAGYVVAPGGLIGTTGPSLGPGLLIDEIAEVAGIGHPDGYDDRNLCNDNLENNNTTQ